MVKMTKEEKLLRKIYPFLEDVVRTGQQAHWLEIEPSLPKKARKLMNKIAKLLEKKNG